MKGRQLLDAMTYIDDALIEEAEPSLESGHTVDFAAKRRRWKALTACAAVFAVTLVSFLVWKSGIVPQERIALEQAQNAAGAYDNGGVSEGGVSDDEILLENAPAEAQMEAENAVDDFAAAKDDNAVGTAVSGGISADTEALEEAKHKDAVTEEAEGSITRVIEEFPLSAVYCYAVPEKESVVIGAGLEAAIRYYDYDENTIDLAVPENYFYHVTIDVFGETDDGDGGTNWGVLQFSEDGKEKLYEEYERMRAAGLDVSLSEDYELTGMLDYVEIENFAPYSEYGYLLQLVNEN